MSRPRSWRNEADLTPEERAKLAAIRARRATPEARAEEEAIIEAVREEVPPLRPDAETAALIAELRQRRERRGLSLDDVAGRSGIPRAALGGLEDGRNPSPTLALLRRYAAAVDLELRVTLAEARPAAAAGATR
jgi:DNA-binding XRE family transcriptional regulator